MKRHQYMLTVRRSTITEGELIFARSHAVVSESATVEEMDAEAIGALAEQLLAASREKVA